MGILVYIHNWFQNNLDFVFFVYGSIFIILGTSIIVQPKRDSDFEIARVLWLFVAYALLHAPADFIDMWSIINGTNYSFHFIGEILTFSSYSFVFEFGRRIIRIAKPGLTILSSSILPIVIVSILTISFFSASFWISLNILFGYFIRLPGGVMAGLGLILYYNHESESLKHIGVKKYFLMGGIALLSWAFFSGIIRNKGDFFPANFLNVESFFLTVNIPIQIFISVCAIIVVWSFTGILKMFNWETREKTQNAFLREKRTKDYFNSIIKNMSDTLIVTDSQGIIKSVNRAAIVLLQYEAEEITGKSIDMLFEDDVLIKEIFDKLYVKDMTDIVETTYITKSGDKVPILLSFYCIDKNTRQFSDIVGIATDITERKHMIEALQKSHNELDYKVKERTEEIKNLTSEIINISEMERQRIGQDLHDDLTQYLMAIEVLCKILHENLSLKFLSEANDAKEIINFLNNVIIRTRTAAKGLCPVSFEPEGFISAITIMINDFKKVFNIKFRLKIKHQILLHDNITALHLYHIAQEAVNNALKHGNPNTIIIEFLSKNDRIELKIIDDGIGIQNIYTYEGLGLRIMKYRASMIGASLTIYGTKYRGTVVTCSLQTNISIIDNEISI